MSTEEFECEYRGKSDASHWIRHEGVLACIPMSQILKLQIDSEKERCVIKIPYWLYKRAIEDKAIKTARLIEGAKKKRGKKNG